MSLYWGGRRGTDTTPEKISINMNGPGIHETKACGAGTPSAPQMGTQIDYQNNTTDKERTWSMKITGEAVRDVMEINKGNETRREEENEQSIKVEADRTSETEIDINDLAQVNRIYRNYVRDPKEPEVGGEEIDLEILLVNSLKINAGKIQEITDSFLTEKEYISIFCLTETKVNCTNLKN